MKSLEDFIGEIERLPYTGKLRCIEELDNLLQDIISFVGCAEERASGELMELKNCTWVLHERYHMDTEAELKFTFHHTKHRMMKSCVGIRERQQRRQEISGESTLMAIEWNGTAA